MTASRVDIQVDEQFEEALALDDLAGLLVRVAEATLDREHQSGPDHVTLVITDNETLQRLNREFMGYDEVTDVLSFNTTSGASMGAAPEADEDWPEIEDMDEEEQDHLGDVIISYPKAVEQAEAAGHPLARELSVLASHGVLHLLGYDHAEEEERRVMFGKMDAVLNALLGPVSDSPGSTGGSAE